MHNLLIILSPIYVLSLQCFTSDIMCGTKKEKGYRLSELCDVCRYYASYLTAVQIHV